MRRITKAQSALLGLLLEQLETTAIVREYSDNIVKIQLIPYKKIGKSKVTDINYTIEKGEELLDTLLRLTGKKEEDRYNENSNYISVYPDKEKAD